MSKNAQKSAAGNGNSTARKGNNDPVAAAIAAAKSEAVEAESLGQRGRPKNSFDRDLAVLEDRIVEAAGKAVAGQDGKAVPILGIVAAVLEAAGREGKTQPSSLIVRKTFREKVKAAGLVLGSKTQQADGGAVKIPFVKVKTADDPR